MFQLIAWLEEEALGAVARGSVAERGCAEEILGILLIILLSASSSDPEDLATLPPGEGEMV